MSIVFRSQNVLRLPVIMPRSKKAILARNALRRDQENALTKDLVQILRFWCKREHAGVLVAPGCAIRENSSPILPESLCSTYEAGRPGVNDSFSARAGRKGIIDTCGTEKLMPVLKDSHSRTGRLLEYEICMEAFHIAVKNAPNASNTSGTKRQPRG